MNDIQKIHFNNFFFKNLKIYTSVDFVAYRTDEGKPWVLPVVRRTEQAMAANEVMNHEYLPVLGLDSFSSAATRMLLGKDSKAIAEGRVRIFHFFIDKDNELYMYKNNTKNG